MALGNSANEATTYILLPTRRTNKAGTFLRPGIYDTVRVPNQQKSRSAPGIRLSIWKTDLGMLLVGSIGGREAKVIGGGAPQST